MRLSPTLPLESCDGHGAPREGGGDISRSPSSCLRSSIASDSTSFPSTTDDRATTFASWVRACSLWKRRNVRANRRRARHGRVNKPTPDPQQQRALGKISHLWSWRRFDNQKSPQAAANPNASPRSPRRGPPPFPWQPAPEASSPPPSAPRARPWPGGAGAAPLLAAAARRRAANRWAGSAPLLRRLPFSLMAYATDSAFIWTLKAAKLANFRTASRFICSELTRRLIPSSQICAFPIEQRILPGFLSACQIWKWKINNCPLSAIWAIPVFLFQPRLWIFFTFPFFFFFFFPCKRA